MKDVNHQPDPKYFVIAVIDYHHEVAKKVRRPVMGNIEADKRQGKQVMNTLAIGLKPNKVRKRIKRERVMWTRERDEKFIVY